MRKPKRALSGRTLVILATIIASLGAAPAANADAVQDVFLNQGTDIHVTLPVMTFADIELVGTPNPCVYQLNAEAELKRMAGSSSVFEAATVTGSTNCPRYPTVQLSIVDSAPGLPTYTTACGPKTAASPGGPVTCRASQTVSYAGAPPRATSEVAYTFTVSRAGVVKGCVNYTVRLVYGTQVSGSPEPC